MYVDDDKDNDGSGGGDKVLLFAALLSIQSLFFNLFPFHDSRMSTTLARHSHTQTHTIHGQSHIIDRILWFSPESIEMLCSFQHNNETQNVADSSHFSLYHPPSMCLRIRSHSLALI